MGWMILVVFLRMGVAVPSKSWMDAAKAADAASL